MPFWMVDGFIEREKLFRADERFSLAQIVTVPHLGKKGTIAALAKLKQNVMALINKRNYRPKEIMNDEFYTGQWASLAKVLPVNRPEKNDG